MEFAEEFHRGKVPALYYIESTSHSPDLSLVMLYLIPWLSGTYQVFFHCGDTFYLLKQKEDIGAYDINSGELLEELVREEADK